MKLSEKILSISESKDYYIGERDNPQFKKPYYVRYGMLSKAEVKKKEDTSYGSMTLTAYKSKDDYLKEIDKLEKAGFSVKSGAQIKEAIDEAGPSKNVFAVFSDDSNSIAIVERDKTIGILFDNDGEDGFFAIVPSTPDTLKVAKANKRKLDGLKEFITLLDSTYQKGDHN